MSRSGRPFGLGRWTERRLPWHVDGNPVRAVGLRFLGIPAALRSHREVRPHPDRQAAPPPRRERTRSPQPPSASAPRSCSMSSGMTRSFPAKVSLTFSTFFRRPISSSAAEPATTPSPGPTTRSHGTSMWPPTSIASNSDRTLVPKSDRLLGRPAGISKRPRRRYPSGSGRPAVDPVTRRKPTARQGSQLVPLAVPIRHSGRALSADGASTDAAKIIAAVAPFAHFTSACDDSRWNGDRSAKIPSNRYAVRLEVVCWSRTYGRPQR